MSEKAQKALTQVGMQEFLESSERQLDTPLFKGFDDEGIELSGGEAQKVALARALYKDSPLLILDEPTAALDPLAEQDIFLQFNSVAKQKTVVFISHRLSACRFSDLIYVFQDGRVVQSGKHSDLLKEPDGLYQELWHAQEKYYRT